eukprot:485842-Amphidinium_carterae.3
MAHSLRMLRRRQRPRQDKIQHETTPPDMFSAFYLTGQLDQAKDEVKWDPAIVDDDSFTWAKCFYRLLRHCSPESLLVVLCNDWAHTHVAQCVREWIKIRMHTE